MSDPMLEFTTRQADDYAKLDLELTCDRCGTHICDVQDGDNLYTLCSVARDHECPRRDEAAWTL